MKIQGLVDALEEVAVEAGMEDVSCLKADKVARVAADEYRQSRLNIEVDATALSLYLAIMVNMLWW